MLLLLSVIKAICEILALALAGQGIMWVIAGKSRQDSFPYRMFAAVTRPLMRITRATMPRAVLDRHIWMVAALVVLVFWVFSTQQKLKHCVTASPESPLCVEMVRALKERGR